MTKEEAIKMLRKEIECLSHSRCEDCILEKACNPMKTPLDSEYIEAYEISIKALEQEQARWIPVRERVPEEKGTYLVTQKATFTDYVYISVAGYALNLYDVDEYDFADKKRPGWYEYDREWGYRELDDVIAWMPLPTPFRAESEVQE